MPQFEYHHNAKIITWERTDFTVEAATQEEADQIARKFTGYDIDESDAVTLGDTTIDFSANMLIPVADNNGQPTVEVYRGDDKEEGEPLSTNIVPVADRPAIGVIRATAIFGEMAVEQYNRTGAVPPKDQEWDDGSLVVHKEFASEELYDAYASALEESDGTTGWRLLRQK